LLLPLWALYAYDKSALSKTDESDAAFAILTIFFRRCGTVDHLLLVSPKLLWDGTQKWVFRPGAEAGLSIRLRESEDGGYDLLQTLSRVQGRVSKYIQLVTKGVTDNDVVAGLFLSLTRQWLLPSRPNGHGSNLQNPLVESDTPLSRVPPTAVLLRTKDFWS
jgi:hypothetical protein